MDDRTALEEVRLSDRELLAVSGELANNHRAAVLFMRKYPNRGNPGEVRIRELRESVERMDLALARIDGLAREGRAPIPYRELESELPAVVNADRVVRHALEVLDTARRVDGRRLWLREVFDAWSQETEGIEPLGSLEDLADQRRQRRQELDRVARRYLRRLLTHRLSAAVVVAGITLFIAYSLLTQ